VQFCGRIPECLAPAACVSSWMSAVYRTLLTLTLVSLLTIGANAQRQITGEEMAQPCAQALLGDSADSLDFMPMAFCIGVISGISSTAPHLETGLRFCIPPDTTRDEPLAKVVEYMEAHAERLKEDFFVLAFQALRQSWPCPKPPPVAPKDTGRDIGASTKAASIAASTSNPRTSQKVEYPSEHVGLRVEATGTAQTQQDIPQVKPRPKKTAARKSPRQAIGISPLEMFGIFPSRAVWPP
jgi:hypothetical protein